MFPVYETLKANFTEITGNDSSLNSGYIASRYESLELHPRKKLLNTISTWDKKQRVWTSDIDANLATQHSVDFLEDRAQRAIALFALGRVGSRRESVLGRSPLSAVNPPDRMLFIQGTIGCGKSTLVHHFTKLTCPRINQHNGIPLRLKPIVINLNNLDPTVSIVDNWITVLESVKTELETTTNLVTEQDWALIARPESHNAETGTLLPKITLAQDPQEALRSIIHQSSDPKIFIKRVSEYISNNEKDCALLLVFDNLDIISSISSQLDIIRKIHALLAECSDALAIITLREKNVRRQEKLRDYEEFFNVRRLSVANPIIGNVVQKRFDMTIKELQADFQGYTTFRVMERVQLTLADIKKLLLHVKTAFKVHGQTSVPGPSSNENIRANPGMFLQAITNGNTRDALAYLLEALSSWALQVDSIVQDYIYQRDNNHDIDLPNFRIDELLRLLFVGEYRFYDSERNGHIVNLFQIKKESSNFSVGRFPHLLPYRFCNFIIRNESLNVGECLQASSCYGYTVGEVLSLIQKLIDLSFIETETNSAINNKSEIFATEKCIFYIRHLFNMFTYLENIRNDCVLTYDVEPHNVRSPIIYDFRETLKFIAFLFLEEQKELIWMKESDERLVQFREMLGTEPLAFTLLKSVTNRLNSLFEQLPRLFSDPNSQEAKKEFKTLQNEIRTAIEKGHIMTALTIGTVDHLELRIGDDSGSMQGL